MNRRIEERVVITGLGVTAPNGKTIPDFEQAIRAGESSIRYFEELAEKKFSCCLGGMPDISEADELKYLTPLQLRKFNSPGIMYGCLAGGDAWQDAGLIFAEEEPYWDSGCVFGTGGSSAEKSREGSKFLLNAEARNQRRHHDNDSEA